MHPIHYSLILNIVILAITGFLALEFREPWLVILAILLSNHSLAKFQDQDDDEDNDSQAMGFLANVK